MRYKAVIFDLFGTLVGECGGGFCALLQREGVLKPLSEGREAEFTRLWESRDARRMRTIGIVDTPADAIRYVCEQLAVTPGADALAFAVELRMDWFASVLAARPEAAATLRQIRQIGPKLALMSDTSAEVPWLWPRTELARHFDEALFSCQVGLATPHPRFYELACERLDVRSADCLYVSARGKALAGARQAGMDVALLSDRSEESLVMNRPEATNWHVARISTVGEVMGILVNGAAASVP